MATYYVQSSRVRLILDARTPRDAALKAIQWSCDRQAEVLAEPADDRIREAEILEWQLDDQITVNETGFTTGRGKVFDTAELTASRAVGDLRQRVAEGRRPLRGGRPVWRRVGRRYGRNRRLNGHADYFLSGRE